MSGRPSSPPRPSRRPARSWPRISPSSARTSTARRARLPRPHPARLGVARLAAVPPGRQRGRGGHPGGDRALGPVLVPIARRRRAHHRRRADRGGCDQPPAFGGRHPAQRGALPLPGAGRCADCLGRGRRRRDHRGLPRVALGHRAAPGGVRGQRLAGRDPSRGPGPGRARLADLCQVREDLRRPVPGPDQGRLLPALRRPRRAGRTGRQGRRVGGSQHRRHRPARSRGDARPAAPSSSRRPRCAPRGCSRPPPCWPRR